MSHYQTFNIDIPISGETDRDVIEAFVATLRDCYGDGVIHVEDEGIYIDIGGEGWNSGERAEKAIDEFVRDHASDWCTLSGENGGEHYEDVLTPKTIPIELAVARCAAEAIREEWKKLTPELRRELVEELLTEDEKESCGESWFNIDAEPK